MIIQNRIKPEQRRGQLKKLLYKRPLVRAIEVHNGISAMVASNALIETNDCCQKKPIEFDALWASSLTDAASKGLPDIELISLDSRLATIEQIMSVSNKPVIVDGDTGRDIDSFEYFLTRLEVLGVSAIVIEDKIFPKRNSLDENSIQNLEDPEVFCRKMRAGRDALLSEDFMIFARLESMIAGERVEDAIARARVYLETGVDGILVHARDKNPSNVFKFASEYNNLTRQIGIRKPLICIPTTYNMVTEKDLQDKGFNIVIYANHLMRASIKSMQDICKIILSNGRAFETEPFCVSVGEVFDLVGFAKIKQRDIEHSKARVVILAAGKPKEEIVKDGPIAMLEINGKCILQRQIDVLSRCGISDILVLRGYERSKFDINRARYIDVTDYSKGSMHTLSIAKEEIKKGFTLIFSDILFNESIINKLTCNKDDIAIVVDATYPYHKHEIDKELDLVIMKQRDRFYREPFATIAGEASFLGKKIKKDIATHEFIGIAKFSSRGAQNLISVYEDCLRNFSGKFHESENVSKASILDILQEMIDRGFKVQCVETHKGWIEIHNKKDYAIAKKIFKDITVPTLS